MGTGFRSTVLASLILQVWSLSPPLSPKPTPFSSSLFASSSSSSSSVSDLIANAQEYLLQNNTNDAFECLTSVYAINSKAPGLLAIFEDLFRTKIRMATDANINDKDDTDEGVIDEAAERMGLASLLADQERHEEAAYELRLLLQQKESATGGSLSQAMRERAAARMFRSLAAICNWENYEQDSLALLHSVQDCIEENNHHADSHNNEDIRVPALHPFEALKWACISLEDATNVAETYARRAMINVDNTKSMEETFAKSNKNPPTRSIQAVSRDELLSSKMQQKRINLGYISPDFTGTHPLAFLMQDVFRFHNQSQFHLYIYSLEGNDGSSPEVTKIRNAASYVSNISNNSNNQESLCWKVFPAGASSRAIASTIRTDDQLDILVDLCGYAGTALVAEVMAHRVAPVQISYMGFPGSSGAPYLDYMIVDSVVVPPHNSIRKHYSEKLIYMPHCYFVNSHRHIMNNTVYDSHWDGKNNNKWDKYGLPADGLIFCCHNRPDKIDPATFRVWLAALKQIREQAVSNLAKNAVLWLLKSGEQMEVNLRQLARTEFQLDDDCLVFAAVVPREEHLERLSLAHLFLDTPAYNAHTVGCDALYAGVPMVSLLRPISPTSIQGDKSKSRKLTFVGVPTEKLASRVGASLLKAVGLEELIVPDMQAYHDLMVRCATDWTWFSDIQRKLAHNKEQSPLFDTERWVRNLEVALCLAKDIKEQDDIAVIDYEGH